MYLRLLVLLTLFLFGNDPTITRFNESPKGCLDWLRDFEPGAKGDFTHPLDPLTSQEIQDTVTIIRHTRPAILYEGIWVFNWITLKEPDKSLLLPYFLNDIDPSHSVSMIPRRSFTVLLEKQQNIVEEVVVNLNSRKVESWIRLPDGTQATFTSEESLDAELIAKNDPLFQERCRQMGWTNMSLIAISACTVGYGKDRPVLNNAKRLLQLYPYGTLFDGDNDNAHPFDFVATVDLALRKVIAIDNLPSHSDSDFNNREGNICPKTPSNYDPKFKPLNFLRIDLNPLYMVQPKGPSFQILGNEITWQKFRFRIGFTGREGPVLYHVSYTDGSVKRPLFYKMSVGEVFVPYGDPRPPYHQKFPFEQGELFRGYSAVNLKDAGICRGGVVTYVDVFLNNEKGTPILHSNVLCIYEEDTGLMFAHRKRDGKVVHARSQRLTITSFMNAGNYDYKYSWHFYQDATIEFNVELSGVLGTQLLAENVTNTGGFGSVVFPQINAQYHQHNFGLRLDTEIDGNINTVSTFDIIPLSDPSGSQRNQYGQGFTTVERILRTTAEARTNISPLTGRNWIIRNPGKFHPYSKLPVSWKLVPYNAPPAFVRKDSPMHSKAAWTDYNVWVTKYKEDQTYPGGFYANNGSGLPEWVADDPTQDLTHTDVVLWYVFGLVHIPSVEEFPIMNSHSAGFLLKPSGFFLENPALDVPPPPPQHF